MRDQCLVVSKHMSQGRQHPLLEEEAELFLLLGGLLWVWEDYRDVIRGRQNTLSGPSLLNHTMVRAWMDNRQITAPMWEVDLLFEIDETYLSELMTPPEESGE